MREGPDPSRTAYQRALRRLARRDHAEWELRRALVREGFPKEAADQAIARLRKEGYLGDLGFAARFARSRMQHRGLGRIRVRRELEARGVGRPIAEAGVAEALQDVREEEAVDALARAYWRQRSRDAPARRLPKLYAFLLRRGFPSPLIRERLSALWPRWRDALDGLDPVEGE